MSERMVIPSSDPLYQEIIELLSLGYEGGYWDYKSDFPDTHEEKLHDIICMANNLMNRDAYLIYGVNDDGTVCGIEKTDKKRYTTKSLVEFLRTKSFAGGYVPQVEVKTMCLLGHEIDVVTIHNDVHTPFFLEKEFGSTQKLNDRLKPGAIYTRTEDINTPRNETASFGHTEYLWRKRFGFDMQPFERFQLLLQDVENWSEANWDTIRHSYHKWHPEYQIVVSTTSDAFETLQYFYDDEKMLFAPLQLKYLSTTLFETEMWYMDMGRCVIPAPNKKVLFDKYLYYYFCLDDTLGHVFRRITDGKSVCQNRMGLDMPVLVFANEDERRSFDIYMDNADLLSNASEIVSQSALFQHILAKETADGTPQIGGVTTVAICFFMYKNWKRQRC